MAWEPPGPCARPAGVCVNSVRISKLLAAGLAIHKHNQKRHRRREPGVSEAIGATAMKHAGGSGGPSRWIACSRPSRSILRHAMFANCPRCRWRGAAGRARGQKTLETLWSQAPLPPKLVPTVRQTCANRLRDCGKPSPTNLVPILCQPCSRAKPSTSQGRRSTSMRRAWREIIPEGVCWCSICNPATAEARASHVKWRPSRQAPSSRAK